MASNKNRVVAGLVAAGLASAALYSPSQTGKDIIKKHEGLVQVAYLDPVNIPTICWGSTINVRLGHRATLVECNARLDADLKVATKAVRRLVTVPITQGQFDALVSFTYNVGEGALARSTLLAHANQGDSLGCYSAARQFDRWVYAGGQRLNGLVTRRQDERGMFEQGCVAWPS